MSFENAPDLKIQCVKGRKANYYLSDNSNVPSVHLLTIMTILRVLYTTLLYKTRHDETGKIDARNATAQRRLPQRR